MLERTSVEKLLSPTIIAAFGIRHGKGEIDEFKKVALEDLARLCKVRPEILWED